MSFFLLHLLSPFHKRVVVAVGETAVAAHAMKVFPPLVHYYNGGLEALQSFGKVQ